MFDTALFDDGRGMAQYLVGFFELVDGVAASAVARWDGAAFEPLGAGLGSAFTSLPGGRAALVHDDGSGAALYVGGTFQQAGGLPIDNLARWDGSSWSSVGGSFPVITGDAVLCMAVHDFGQGSQLFVGGEFTEVGGTPAVNIARWDGTNWHAVGAGTNDLVRTLEVHDDGSGPALYVGGDFFQAGGIDSYRVARWRAAGWEAVGGGIGDDYVAEFASIDFGAGPRLFAAGRFLTAAGQDVGHIASWDGAAWGPVGGGLGTLAFADVRELTVHDDGSGLQLYAGGLFDSAGALGVPGLARWDGASWSLVGEFQGAQTSALSTDDPLGAGRLLAFAIFEGARTLQTWDGAGWEYPLALTNGRISTALARSGELETELYIGGDFSLAGGVEALGIARWDGSSYTPLGAGVDGSIRALAWHDAGSGPELIAAGSFSTAGGVPAARIARWDGSAWHPLGSGMDFEVLCLLSFEDSQGSHLIAGGSFTEAGGVPALKVARWDGSSWSAMGAGLQNPFDAGFVEALCVLDDGTGPALYAGGAFHASGAVPLENIARWNGSTWEDVAGGFPGFISGVASMTVFDDGAGPRLIAGGRMDLPAGHVAQLVGNSWQPLGSGLDGWVTSLQTLDLGQGQRLFAAGQFEQAGGTAAAGLAQWDGSSWAPLGSGMGPELLTSNQVTSQLAVLASPTGPSLLAVGRFGQMPDSGDSYIARWGCGLESFTLIDGCSAFPAVLSATTSSAVLGNTARFQLEASATNSGFGLLYGGQPGVDPMGCGSVVPGLGEVLLELLQPPAQFALVPLVDGGSEFAIPVPASPAFAGLQLALQGVAADASAVPPIQVSQGLGVELLP